MQRDSTVTPASDDRIALDQYGAVAGADGAFPSEFNSGRRPTRYILGRNAKQLWRQHMARAVRLAREHASDYGSEWTAMKAISGRLGMTAETVA